jgi:hypothetical protein
MGRRSFVSLIRFSLAIHLTNRGANAARIDHELVSDPTLHLEHAALSMAWLILVSLDNQQ